MNKRQKLVQQQFLGNEEAVIRRLKAVYNQSLKDIESKTKVLQNEINNLQAAYNTIDDEKERARLKSMQQSKIYQKGYQDALKKQINSILDNMQVEEFETVADYLNKCYEEGFLGTVYDLHGQGIPVMFPIDQEAVVRAVQLDSKISQGLYQRLGEDIDLLKRKITAQVSRGISTGMSFDQVAQQLVSYTNIGFNNAVRIARTEGHRIQVQSGLDACYKAKEKGADVVKQWDSTLDGSTRPSHKKVDGEIRELDEKFSNGLMFPGDPSGGATEVVNCRCALLQRARWALDEEELATLKERADYYGLDKSDNFKEFKEKYLNAVDIEKGLENIVKNSTIKLGSSSTIAMAKKLPNAKERSRIINEAINAGSPIYANDLREAYKRVKPKDGCMDICLHGTPYYTEYEHKYIIDTETLAYIISGRRDFSGDDIRLLSCSTGQADKYGNCVAQELANRLNVRIYAPTKVLNIHPDGKLSVGREQLSEDEGFKWFEPKKGGEK